MAEFDAVPAQAFQGRVLERVREVERMLDREVVEYYGGSRVNSEQEAYDNLRGLHKYLKRAYADLDQLMSEIENRQDYNI